jgi:hypothetical protein
MLVLPPNFPERLNEMTGICDGIVKTLETIPIKDRQIPLFKMIKDLEKMSRLLKGCFEGLVHVNSPKRGLSSNEVLNRK